MQNRSLQIAAVFALVIIVALPQRVILDEWVSAAEMKLQASAAPDQEPLLFIENVGQFDARARFQARGIATALFLATDALWFTIYNQAAATPDHQEASTNGQHVSFGGRPAPKRGVHLKLSFADANRQPRLEPFDRQETPVSYFGGGDPAGWHADVPVWGGVRYRDLYPGIDLELHGAGGQLQPQLVVQPGARLSAVRLRVEGAEQIAVRGHSIQVTTGVGELTLPLLPLLTRSGLPLVWRETTPLVQGDEVDTPFATSDTTTLDQHALTAANSSPSLGFSTFVGGRNGDYSSAMVVDSRGATYITGSTSSPDFPTTPGAFDRTFGAGVCGNAPNTYACNDAFVVKLDASGSRLIYAAFLGGSGDECFNRCTIAVDGAEAAYVTGYTNSTNFPTTAGAFDQTYDGNTCGAGANTYPCYDAFVAKLDPSGSSLSYATYLGGKNDDNGDGIAVDASGAAYITGYTFSTDFPTTSGAVDRGLGGAEDAFVAKLNPDGSSLVYATFLGGSERDCIYCDIAIDTSGNAYITGWTTSSNFPTTPGAFDRTFGGSGCAHLCNDSFVLKLNANGSALVYASYLGGSDGDGGDFIAVDGSGAAYVIGYTFSTDFPTTSAAVDTSINGTQDAFIAKMNPSGAALEYATFLGGSGDDSGTGIAVDRGGSAYVVGTTISANFPTTADGFDRSYGGGLCGSAPNTYACYDGFVAQLNSNGSTLSYATFLGGSHNDTANGIALHKNSSIYVTGNTASSDFPTTPGAFSTICGGCDPNSGDGFVAQFSLGVLPIYIPLTLRTPTNCSDIENANDDQVEAPRLTPLGFDCEGSLEDDPIGEDDWYWVDLPAGKTLTVHLSGMAAGADYNLYLWRFDIDTRVGASEQTGQADEQLDYTNHNATSVRIHLRIRIASKVPNLPDTYTLKAGIK